MSPSNHKHTKNELCNTIQKLITHKPVTFLTFYLLMEQSEEKKRQEARNKKNRVENIEHRKKRQETRKTELRI